MRRTTICRSETVATALLLALAAVSNGRAQQPAAPPAQTPPAVLPATHVVAPGETLWSLAERYFGDPLLWPEIYRLNTDVIEDPRWIYPGEELRLVAAAAAGTVVTPQAFQVTPSGDTVRAAPPAAQAPEVTAPTVFARPRGPVAAPSVQVTMDETYRVVREGEYYSAGFLTELRPGQTGRIIGSLQTSAIRRAYTRSSATLFGDLLVRPAPADTLRPGDLLLVLRRSDEIRGYGDVIVPTGLLRVSAVDSAAGTASARVIAMYGYVQDNQELIKVTPFRFDTNARPVEVSDGIEARVVGTRDFSGAVAPQSVIFLDKGFEDGVRLGDVFVVSGPSRQAGTAGNIPREQARVIVVNAQARTASAVIVSLSQPDLRAGSTARQIRRMPS